MVARHFSSRVRTGRLTAALLALSLAAVACPAVEEGPGELGDPVHGGSITVGLEAETNNWLPGTGSFASPGLHVAYSIYDPLMMRDEDGGPQPYLAESLEPNDELTEWTLTLREGVQFHDGTDLNAEAIRTIFDDYLKAPGSNLLGVLADVESVEVIDELTAVYQLNQANAAFPDILTGASGWPFSPTAAAELGEDAGSQPVGTGPFVFESWQRDSQLVVTRNDNYWQEGLPYLDRIVFRPIPDEDSRLASVQTRDVDAMHSLRQSIVRQARDTAGVDVYEFIGNSSGSAIINTERPPADDVRVRRALAYALNQEDLVAVLGGEGISPAQTQFFSVDSPWYSDQVARAWPTNDPGRAQSLLEEYMNDPQRSDGRAVGEPVAVEFNCQPDASLLELAQVYQAQWQAAGFQVRLNQVEQATHIQNAQQGNYMINCWRVGSEQDPYLTFWNAFGPPDQQPLNYTRFTHPDTDEQLEILRTSLDFDERYEAVETIGMLLTEHVPNTFTGSTATTIAVRPELRNIDTWELPDGTPGEGTVSAATVWGQVWLAE